MGHRLALGPEPNVGHRAPTSNGSPGALFTDYLWPFEVPTILLVVAVVGGVVLARRSGLSAETEYELDAGRRGSDAEEQLDREETSTS